MMLFAPAAARAQAARVVDVRGTSIVERAGAPPRILGSGEQLDQRDTVSVARDSWAILEFSDRTRVTLRPDTVFRIDAYSAGAPGSMLMGLVKGGFRAVTGLIGRRNPDSVKFQTAMATIGIRGTEFDARLCDADCAAEERARPAPRPLLLPVARVVEMNGIVAAARAGQPGRVLVPGAGLHEGDGVATGPGAYAVLVFRDGARVTLEGNSRLAINRFRYRESAPADGSAYLTLYAGQAQVWTGKLAKISSDAFLVRSAMGVIRPHGTGFSVSGCIGSACASVSGNVNSSGASGSASGSAGNTSASASGSASSSGASGSTSASAGGNTASASGSAGSSGGSATIVTPFSTGTMSAGPGGVTQSSSSPLGTSSTGIGPGGVSVSTTGVSGSSSLNVGAGGVSGSGTQNLPGGASVTVGGNASVSNQGTVSASGSVTGGAGGQTATVGGSGSQAAPTTRVTANQDGISATFGAYSAQAGKEGAGASYQSGTLQGPGGTSVGVGGSVGVSNQGTVSASGSVTGGAGGQTATVGGSGSQAAPTTRVTANQDGISATFGAYSAQAGKEGAGASYQSGTLQGPGGTSVGVGGSVGVSNQGTVSASGTGSASAGGQNVTVAGSASPPPSPGDGTAPLLPPPTAGQLLGAAQDAGQSAVDTAKGAADAAASAANEAERLAGEIKATADAKAAADKRLAEQKFAGALQDFSEVRRQYDITGGVIAVVGPPNVVVPPGLLDTLPGAPTVVTVGDRTITTWVEAVVRGVPTNTGGSAIGGTVTRTEVSGPDGVTTTLVFDVMFVSPMVTGLVTQVGGPLISLGPDKSGTVQVTHRAPDGTTTVSYPGNQDGTGNPASVAVLDGEVEVVGRGRVRSGEMLAGAGGPSRVASLPATQDIKVDPNLFGGDGKAIDEGLYVWVRDGAVQVQKDEKTVDVPAGNAAVATKDKVELLDAVPNFMRFDPTPRPAQTMGDAKVDAFRAPDGAILNMCVVR